MVKTAGVFVAASVNDTIFWAYSEICENFGPELVKKGTDAQLTSFWATLTKEEVGIIYGFWVLDGNGHLGHQKLNSYWLEKILQSKMVENSAR